jgi:hypothetical protein
MLLGHILGNERMVTQPVGLLAWYEEMRAPGRHRLVHLLNDPRQVCRFWFAFLARDEGKIPLRRVTIGTRTAAAQHEDCHIWRSVPVLPKRRITCSCKDTIRF